MKKRFLFKAGLLLLTVMIGIAPIGSLAEIQDTQPTELAYTTIESGPIMGMNYEGVYNFRGIPYAKAERFQMPEKVTPWTDARPCLSWGVACPQPYMSPDGYTSFTEFMTPSDHNFIFNEDCQNLNVWTNSLDAAAMRPVIVFLHGGGFTGGSSMELVYYDGHNITASGDVVFVSVNHRLNVVGSLDLSPYDEKYKYSANCGMADIVAALQWVHDNITAFGGDPSNVTLVGQSGGTLKVQALLGIPSAKGLFSKAVLQSHASDLPLTAVMADRRAQSDKVLELLGIGKENISEIETVPYDQLIAAAMEAGLVYGPCIDDDFYPAKPWVNGEEIEMSKDIPIIASSTYSETSDNFAPIVLGMKDGFYRPEMTEEDVVAALTARYGDNTDAIIAEFRKAYPEKDLFDALFIDKARNNNVATIRAKDGGAPVYQVVYAMNYPIFGGVTAIHTGGCLPYLFNNVDKINILIAGNEAAATEMARIASSYLCNFARTGNPNGENVPEWPAFDLENGYTMIMDDPCEARSYHDEKLLELMDPLGEAVLPSGV
ncbi:MAG: carboxylesterase family protein [Eubacteriales bacterium]|nr:carboxylesterase family protein [Eubacteriales bacterium]